MAGSDLMSGTLDLLVLKAVEGGPLHGYAIGRWIRERGEGLLEVEEGVLYPALHRLERRGWLSSHWGKTETGRRAKFYKPTAKGRRKLASEGERWRRLGRRVLEVLQS